MNLVIQEKNFIWTLESQKRLWFYFLFDSVFLKDIREYLKKKKKFKLSLFWENPFFSFLERKEWGSKKKFWELWIHAQAIIIMIIIFGKNWNWAYV